MVGGVGASLGRDGRANLPSARVSHVVLAVRTSTSPHALAGA